MKLHRFIGDYNFSEKEVKIQNPKIIKQIKDILKIKNGEKIVLSNGKGKEAEILLAHLSNKEITGEILEIREKNEITKKVNLFLAVLKKENFELAVQKAVETGAYSITPIITERTIKKGLNTERLEKIILEASEQSGRNILPKLFPVITLKEALQKEAQEKIIFHLCENSYNPKTNSKETNIFIGPEGGFTENELKLAKESDCMAASLGTLTLRAETASTIATYRVFNGI